MPRPLFQPKAPIRASLLGRTACIALAVALAASCGGGEAPAGDPTADTASEGGMVTGTTGAPGPGTVGTPGTPGGPEPDTMVADTPAADSAAADTGATR